MLFWLLTLSYLSITLIYSCWNTQISSTTNLRPLIIFASLINLSLPVKIKKITLDKRGMQHERRKEQKEEETVASLPPSGKTQIGRYISHSQQNHSVLRQKPAKKDQTWYIDVFFFSYTIIISWKEMKLSFLGDTYRKLHIFEILSLILTSAMQYLWSMKRLRSPGPTAVLTKLGTNPVFYSWLANQTSYTNIQNGWKTW